MYNGTAWQQLTVRSAATGSQTIYIAGYQYAYGEWGIGSAVTQYAYTPVAITWPYSFTSVTVSTVQDQGNLGGSSFGIVSGGTGYAWGRNDNGQLGIATGNTTAYSTPTPIGGGLSWSMIANAALDTCGITTAGVGYCWGYNNYGQLGNGSTTQSDTPTAISGGYTWAQISVGGGYNGGSWYHHACGMTTAGVGYCWGVNNNGQLGIAPGNTTTYYVPTAVYNIGVTWKKIVTGFWSTCAITTAGVPYCWGSNDYGQLGIGSTTGYDSPQAVSGGLTFTDIQVGNYGQAYYDTFCGLSAAGKMYCWGSNYYGNAGLGQSTNYATVPTAVLGNLNFKSMSIGGLSTCGITTSNQVYCWGYDGQAQLGDGYAATQYKPEFIMNNVSQVYQAGAFVVIYAD